MTRGILCFLSRILLLCLRSFVLGLWGDASSVGWAAVIIVTTGCRG